MAKILIVDDDIEICDTFSDILIHAGHEVHVARSGTEAFKALRRVSPGVVLLDMNLPGVSGVQLLSYIRHIRRLARARIVIVTGHPELAASAQAVWGADLSLTKPVSPRELLDAVGSEVS